ncbi:hypothetical protein IWQ61_005354 [Dispira simplex]|nr:hypothetical protein IWQ61_005354 [Dispira simplex]
MSSTSENRRPKIYECSCEQRFSVLSNLRRHVRSRHQNGTPVTPYSRRASSRDTAQGADQIRQEISQTFRPLQLAPPHMIRPHAQVHPLLSPAVTQMAHAGLYPASLQYFDGGRPGFLLMSNLSGFASFPSWIPRTPMAMGSAVSSPGMVVPPVCSDSATSGQNTPGTMGSTTSGDGDEKAPTQDSAGQDELRLPTTMEFNNAPNPSFPHAHLLQRRWSAEPSQTRLRAHQGLNPSMAWQWIPASNPTSPLPPQFHTGRPSPSPLGLYPHTHLVPMQTHSSVTMSRNLTPVSGSPVYPHSSSGTSLVPSPTVGNVTANQTLGHSILTPSPMQEVMVMSSPTGSIIGLNPAPSGSILPFTHSHIMTNQTPEVAILGSGLVPTGTFSDLAGEPVAGQPDLREHPYYGTLTNWSIGSHTTFDTRSNASPSPAPAEPTD